MSRTLAVSALLGLSAFLAATMLGANEPANLPGRDRSTDATFKVTVEHARVSLRAKQAPLAKVIDEIGKQMKLDVDADISTHDRITMTFDQLTLDEALEHIFKHRTNYAYSTLVDRSSGRITKIVVLTTEASGPPNSAEPRSEDAHGQRPEPFRFELDPSKD
jgi:hypothetical protein